MSNNDGADFARSISAGEELSRLMVEAEYLREENKRLREALREITEGDRPYNDKQFHVGYWGAKARAALGEGKE
jgi:hypothetical protein